jgi:hypothetical protein
MALKNRKRVSRDSARRSSQGLAFLFACFRPFFIEPLKGYPGEKEKEERK